MKKRGVEDKSETGAAASRKLARELVDPRRYAVGSLKKVYEKYPHIGRVLPAMGYSEEQIIETLKARSSAALAMLWSLLRPWI